MAGNKQVNSDLEILGKAIVSTVPNNTGTVVTYNANSKEISQRTNAQIIADLGLITATNIAAAYYTKAQLQTSGQAQVNWGNLTNIPTTFTPSAHNHDDRYYTETESDDRFVPYTGANKAIDFNTQNITKGGHETKNSTFFNRNILVENGVDSGFILLENVAAEHRNNTSEVGDIVITLPIRSNTIWQMEVDILSQGYRTTLNIGATFSPNFSYFVNGIFGRVDDISAVKFGRIGDNTVIIIKRVNSAFNRFNVNISKFYYHFANYVDLYNNKENYKVEFIKEEDLVGFTLNGTTLNNTFVRDPYLLNWNNLTNIPTTFPATVHNHDDRYYTETESLNLFVGRTGVQTIADTKTFSSSPVVPSPTLDNHAVNRKYVTDNHYTKTEVDNLITNSNADKFVTTISTSGEVEHMLNSYDVSAEFYDIATMFTVGARVQRITTNKIKVEFDSVPTNPIKVLIRKF